MFQQRQEMQMRLLSAENDDRKKQKIRYGKNYLTLRNAAYMAQFALIWFSDLLIPMEYCA